MIDLLIFICFEIILELENIKQHGENAESKISCRNGVYYCDGRLACMCDWRCECSNCADEPGYCFKNGELDQEFIRKFKENPETIPMIPEN